MTKLPKLYLSEQVLEQTFNFFSLYVEKELESGCIWYGLNLGSTLIALQVGIPRQSNFPRHYLIDSEDLCNITTDIVANDFEAVAQIHTHPGSDVRHSGFDDDMIISKNIYSIVFPFYGRRLIALNKVGFHVHNGKRWNLLANDVNSTILSVYCEVVDKR